MNREILFRGKRLENNEWLYGSHFTDSGEDYIIPQNLLGINDYEEYQVDQNTIGQYTGLKDRNGIKIYEGDVLCSTVFDCFGNDMQYTLEVEWLDSEFVASCNRDGEEKSWNLGWLHGQDDEIEVIGNIHDKQQEL